MVAAASKVVPAFLGGFICIYGLVSGFVKERLYLSESLVAMLFGIIIGPQAINVVDPRDFVDTGKFTLEFARYVIAIQVMAAGITLPRRYIVRKWRTMSVMLGPVMVVMWLVTAGIIHLMFEIGFKQALLIASCAAPTDPILANSVVKGRYAEANVPKNVRDALSAESGINDGLGLPFLYFALYLLNESFSTGHAMGRWFYWIWCYNILLSVVIGIVVGYVARKLLRWAESYDLIDKESFLAFSIGLSIFIVGCLQLIRSDDVLCCFIAGHAFTWDDWFREETKDAHFQEVLDGLINVTFFIYFGTIIPWHQFNNAELIIAPWRLIVAAIMVLLLRRLPIVVLLTRLTPAFRNYRQSIFAGWFGPIGVGAIFFAEIVLEEIEMEPEHYHLRSREIIVPIVSFLIFSSVLVHGITLPLVYIGKVVRSRSRSISSMSIRNGVISRLSFVNSREPTGIHGVHIPMINSASGSPVDDYVDDDAKRDSRLMFSTGGISSSDQSPTTAAEDDNDRSPRGSEKDDAQDDAAGPLDLVRTITIDDTPKVSRDQMDIHLRSMNYRAKYAEHAHNLQTPTVLRGPKYSHLLHPGSGNVPPPIHAKSHSAQEFRSSAMHTDSCREEDVGEKVVDKAADVSDSLLAEQARIAAENVARGREDQGSDREHRDRSEESTDQDDDGGGLMLAVDEAIAGSKTASRASTRHTIMSVPEVYRPGSRASNIALGTTITHHASIPDTGGIDSTPSVVAAAHHFNNGSSQQHSLAGPGDLRRRRNRMGSISGIRRILRKRPRQRAVDGGEGGDQQMCQFIGNRTNPLGRLEDGELVDYDDPNDDDPEESFMSNNVDDRFIDYLTLDIGSSIRRLTSRLPGVAGRRLSAGDSRNRDENNDRSRDCGRIAAIGGCEEYTGAPYFSASTSLRLGVDIAYVICEEHASLAIKGYSPDLIVNPYLRLQQKKDTEDIGRTFAVLEKLHSVAVGSGMGVDEGIRESVVRILGRVRERGIPVVVDADALALVCEDPGIVRGYGEAVLTPNAPEFKRLCRALGVDEMQDEVERVRLVAEKLDGVTVVRKGKTDVITNGSKVFVCEEPGGLRRCGGQGDILSGAIAAFLAWGYKYKRGAWEYAGGDAIDPADVNMLAAYAACMVARHASFLAYDECGRATQSSSVLEQVDIAFDNKFEQVLKALKPKK
ncbi:hypothetical protein LPJ75_001477 [Coemansia sp. RSA 2598]|nr:hypothetical protein LPJ75_001477 [Coemansia sp. RSA 2598]